MFVLNNWPKGKNKSRAGGRPKKKTEIFQEKRHETQLDRLYKLNFINEDEYKAGLWYQKAWQLYTLVIEAPKVKTCRYEKKSGGGRIWDEEGLFFIEERWERAQNIIKQCGREAKRVLEDIICFDQPCYNLKNLKLTLQEIDKTMRL